MERNLVALDGVLLKRNALRFTPAGVPVIDILVGHRSVQIEAEHERKVRLEIRATAIGKLALALQGVPLNQAVGIKGFLAESGVKDRRLQLHITALRHADEINQNR